MPYELSHNLRGSFGSYEVLEKIAVGGQAEIYRVRHESEPDRSFALKRIRPGAGAIEDYRKMLMDEARVSSRLDHPQIARVLELAEEKNEFALIMEYIDGLDLEKIRQLAPAKAQGLSLATVIHIVCLILSALDFAHNAKDERGTYLNVVHRDISANNVMIDRQGDVHLVDFGIAWATDRSSVTEVGGLRGNLRYMAPEQLRAGDVTPASDVYACGLLLWELLAGQCVYGGLSTGGLMTRVNEADVPPLAGARHSLPAALSQAYLKATALEPQQRYSSALTFLEALEGTLDVYRPQECRRELTGLVRSAWSNKNEKRRTGARQD